MDVQDYKTGYQIPWDHTNDIQLGLYALSARHVFAWARTIRTTIIALYQGETYSHDWSSQELADTAAAVVGLARRLEADATANKPLRPVLGLQCPTCDLRVHCTAYCDALKAGPPAFPPVPGSIEEVCDEREHIAIMAKL